jgi:hypothetical protein
MKKLICAAIVACLLSVPAQMAGAETPEQAAAKANDQMMISALTMLHMRVYMLELCGVTESDAPAEFAKNRAEEETFIESLSDDARRNLSAEYARMEASIKADWSKSSEVHRAQNCAGIKAGAGVQ